MKRVLKMIIFLPIPILLLYICNLIIYESVAHIFDVNNSAYLVLIGTVLGFLSGNFILSMIVGHKYYNTFTRIYCKVSAMWMGLFVYLFLASTFYGFLLIFFRQGPQVHVLGGVLFILSLFVSIYGVMNAKRIKVVEINVHLPNIPSEWLDRKAVWISDLHLGQIYSQAFVQTVVSKINNIAPSVVFIGGDLFDGTSAPDLYRLIEPLKRLSASTLEFGVYYVTGNHEEFGDNTKFITAVRDAGIRMLQDDMVTLGGLNIIGVDYHNASNRDRFKKILSELSIDSSKPSILLKHEPKDLDIACDANISMQISGHTHRAQIWPLEYLARLIYKGYAYGLKDYKNMKVYTSSGLGTWGPPMRVGTRGEIVVCGFTK